jgi:aspartyl-tRNA(Asn)/glutamyl-tRNA(Gln) amidotransferase subunit A
MLKSRLNDFGADYLSQVLLALLFQAGDYAKAQRHRRVLSEEMVPLYRKYDVLVTAGSGPAPRLDVQGAKDALERWAQPSSTAVFNVTGAPAMMLCSGFSKSGLPLGLQIAGRPFDEACVFQVAHAYQRETQWHQRHPVLTHSKASPFSEKPAPLPPAADPRTCAAIEFLADSAGIRLSDDQIRRVAAGAPMVREMAQRIPDHGWETEPAGLFHCVQWSHANDDR